MTGGFAWPDIIFLAVMALATVKGFSRGFIKEIGGLVAICAAVIAPWYYNGSADSAIVRYTHLGPPFAHAAGMIATSVAAYAVIMLSVLILAAIVKLPVLGTGNRVAGALVGFVKGYVVLWALLFIALFFPLTPAIRSGLHASYIAPYFTAYDSNVDKGVLAAVPSFAKPFLQPYFNLHHL